VLQWRENVSVKPVRYCLAFPCPNLAAVGSAYCSTHQPARAPKQVDDFYVTPRWRRFRDWYLANHPLCEQCEREGRDGVPAVMVDHIVELRDGGEQTAEANAMALCWKCHGIKTAAAKKNRQESSKSNRPGSLGGT
jgi:5-methylcytosine-specific restriction protein A